MLLVAGAFVLRGSAPPDRLGQSGFALLIASGTVLLAGLVVPLARSRLMPRVLATQGAMVVVITTALAISCVRWATDKPGEHSFRYLPGLIIVGMTYGTAQWAEFGWHRSRPRPWRLAGLVLGVALEAIVAAFVVGALLST